MGSILYAVVCGTDLALEKRRKKTMFGPCECEDFCCPVHPGKTCTEHGETHLLFRIDSEDETGTAFCDACADDAMESGLFTT